MKRQRNFWLDNGTGGPMRGAYFEDYSIAKELADDVGAMVRTGPDQVSFLQLMEEGQRLEATYPDLRFGQYMFNALNQLAPDIADLVRGTEFDPYYDDTRVNSMIRRFFAERG